MVIMERILLFYAIVVVAIIKPTTCTTAQTTTEITTVVVTVDSTESTSTTSAMTTTAMTTDVRATTSSSFTTSDPSNTDTTTGAGSTTSFTTNPSSSSSSSMTTVSSVGSTLTPSSLISTMTIDVGTTSSSLTTSGPDSTTYTTTGDASTIPFTTSPSSSSSSSMTTVHSVGSTLTPSALITTMTTDGGTTSSSFTTSGPASPTDTTTGDASTISFTTNPSSSSSSSMTTVHSVGSTLTPSSLISTMTTDGGTTSSSFTTSGPASPTDTATGDASTISFTTNPSSSSSSSMTTVHSVGSTLTSSSLISTMSTDRETTTPSSDTTTEQEIVTDGETTLAASTSSSSPSPITTTEKTEQSSLSSSASPTTSTDMTEATDMTTSTSNTTSNTSNQSSPTEAPTEPPTVPPTARSTKPPAEPTTEPTTRPKVGPVPEPTFPEIDDDAEKTYQFEFAVEEDTAAGCDISNLSSDECEQLKDEITEELIDVYGEIDGFKGIEVGLRAGSIIVNHTVIYTYNDMTDEDRQSSAQSIYDQTLGQAVVGGKLGNYTVIEDCQNCASPEETSNICDLNEPKCPAADFSEPTCTNNFWVCESKCKTSYCNGHGICWQEDLKSQPICSCDWDNGEWYWGYKCQFYANEMHLIIGCSCGAAVLLVLIVSCIAYVCTHTNNKTEKATVASSENGDDDVIHAFRNLGYDQDHTTETANFPPIEDLDEGDILQRSRPYSYIYRARGDDNANTDSTLIIKNQNGGAQRESKLEVNDDAAAKRLSNGSSDTRHSSFLKSNGGYQQRSTEFWGNVDETSASEAIKLEPVLDHIDLNESYKIQRPRISTNYSYSNTATPNAYQSIGSNDHEYETHFIPQPDYTQR